MEPTHVPVNDFLSTVSTQRATEAHALITVMQEVTGAVPVMWESGAIGFGSSPLDVSNNYKGAQPTAAFSPRKPAVAIYLCPTVLRDRYLMDRLGKHRVGKDCLYIEHLADVDAEVLRELITRSYWEHVPPQRNRQGAVARTHLRAVTDYLASVPLAARPALDALRDLVRRTAPGVEEVISYGIIGYRIPGRSKAVRVFVSGWKDHVALYPLPSQEALRTELAPWVRGKGTLWFSLDEGLPTTLLERAVAALLDDQRP